MDMDTNKKTYLVTAKFKLRGNIPSIVEEEHIKKNIEGMLSSNAVVLAGEYYGDCDEEWEMYVEDAQVELDEFKVVYTDEPFCEHCGKNHTDFAAEISKDGTSWCLNCYTADEHSLSDKEIKGIQKEEKRLKKEHYKKKLKELD